MRADVAETLVRVQCFDHRWIIGTALWTSKLGVLRVLRSAPRVPHPAPRRLDRLPNLLTQSVHIHQPETDAAVGLDAARPLGDLYVDRREADAVALRVLDQRRRVIEPH